MVLALLLVLAGGSREEAGESTPPEDSDARMPDRRAVLVYYGHGGVGPEGLSGSMTHADSVALLRDEGLTVEHTATWPPAFGAYRLVILPGPGANDADAEWSALELADLGSVTAPGGVIAIEAEPGSLMNVAPLNALLWDLGSSAYATAVERTGVAEAQGEHALLGGVTGLGMDLASIVDPGDEVCLARADGDCVAAAAPAGEGWIVLIGDGDLLSRLNTWVEQGYDNDSFLLRLAQIHD